MAKTKQISGIIGACLTPFDGNDHIDYKALEKEIEFLVPDCDAITVAAVEAAGHAPSGHCHPLTCLENRVYDVRLEDGGHVIAKFYRPNRWSREGILDEHRFLADLARAEIPVCAPLAFPDGGTLRTVEGIHYALWPRVGGRAPDEFDDDQVAVLGRLLARIHNVGAAGSATSSSSSSWISTRTSRPSSVASACRSARRHDGSAAAMSSTQSAPISRASTTS